MTKDEAIKLVLEALVDFKWHNENCPQFPTWAEPEKHLLCTCGYDKAITALYQAIQEAALQKLTDIHQEMEQKPVAWWNPDESGLSFQKLRGDWQPLYAAPVHAIDINQKHVDETAKDKHEPDAYGDGNVYRGQRSKDSTTKTLHYTALPRREWVGMTDAEAWEEWVKAVDSSNHSDRLLAFRYLRAIEAKLREKNT